MSRRAQPDAAPLVRAALGERLTAAAPYLGVTPTPGVPTADLLAELCAAVYPANDADRSWLLFVAISAAYPMASELSAFRRLISLGSKGTAFLGALEGTLDAASRAEVGLRRIEIVDSRMLVDVGFCATNEHNTGIQRVVRQSMPHWQDRPHVLVAWTNDGTAHRRLTAREADRVLHWNDRQFSGTDAESTEPETIVVPWRSRVFLPEVPQPQLCRALACLAESSGNELDLLGYDAIPIVSADSVPDAESERFAHYLTIVKHASTVVAISASAATEFSGFSDMLATQGLTGPQVIAVPLATEAPATIRAQGTAASAGAGTARARGVSGAPGAAGAQGDLPVVLCVGSHEPRKNQEAVLHAATVLFAEGLRFRMVFVGGGSAAVLHHFDQRVRALKSKNVAVESHRRLPDADLWELFREARFSVFVSLHEGFGLPVAESVSLGVPVLASNFGSVAEVASAGGCVTVDPRNDEAIITAMRQLLTDDDLVKRLVAETRAVRQRTWAEYADELWAAVGMREGSA